MSIRAVIPPGLKRRLRPLYYRGKRRVIDAYRSYGRDDLARALSDLGVRAGDGLFVHAGFDQFNGFRGSATDCLTVLLDSVGADGHVLMTSMAYRGSSEAYARSGAVFDVARTPSAMGMLTEVFRRMDGVHRSASPLHPVLAHGPKARWLVADHDRLARSCGPGSPFERFLRIGGKVLFLDAPFSSLTFMHYVEDVFEDRFPFDVYAPECLPVVVRRADGTQSVVAQRLFGAELRSRRTFDVVEAELARRERLRERRVGNSTLVVVDVQDVFDCGRTLAERGQGLFV